MARDADAPTSDRGVDNALTARLDRDREFKRRHGSCDRCAGTGFEPIVVEGVSYVRRCEALGLGPIVDDAPRARPAGGFAKASDVRLPYRE